VILLGGAFRPPKSHRVHAIGALGVPLPSSLGSPSPQSSVVVIRAGSTPYHDGRYQVYPEPHVEPMMRMNKDQHQYPGKKNPQNGSKWLRDKKPPHVDPTDK
jgi:hypothetical protein